MSTFTDAFTATVGVEGGYSNNPADPGGETMYGITLRVARANGYNGDMHDLPLATAEAIAKKQYWDLYSLDDVVALSYKIAALMFDISYNGGAPGKWLQRALNALDRDKKDYGPVTVDNHPGPLTIAALKSFLALRHQDGETVLLRLIYAQRGEFFLECAEATPSDTEFEFGWALKRLA